MLQHLSKAAPAVSRVLLCALLVAVAAEADAKGRRGGSSRSSSQSSHADKSDDGSGGGLRVNMRNGSSSSSSSSSSSASSSRSNFQPIDGQGSDDTRREAPSPAQERALAMRSAAERAEEARVEAQRQADEKAAQARLAELSQLEQAEAARQAAAMAQKKREDAAIAADVDRVLQRAMADYPVLRTPQGEPVLQRIKERQAVLAAQGLYPSTAMVEAVSDYAETLAPRSSQSLHMVRTNSAGAEHGAASVLKAYGGCRWTSPVQWSCPSPSP